MEAPPSIQRMATEILAHIFEAAVHTPAFIEPETYSGIASHSSNRLTPLTLSHVCKDWRNITFSLSILWSTIYFTNGGPRSNYVSLFELWLQNSGTQPLKLHFQEPLESTHAMTLEASQVLQLAAKHSTRWVSFKLRMRSPDTVATIASLACLAHIPTPQLETLAFTLTSESLNRETYWALWSSLLRNSPRLKEVHIRGPNEMRQAQYPPLFNQITALHLTLGQHVVRPLLFASQFKALEFLHLSAEFSVPVPPDAVLPAVVFIPTLHHLLITIGRYSMGVETMNLLRVPALTHFTLQIVADHGNTLPELRQAFASVEEMMKRSEARLESFSYIDHYTDNQTWLIPFFYHPSMRGLTDLRVENKEFTLPSLSILTVAPWDPADIENLDFVIKSTALPCLRRMHLRLPHEGGDYLVEMGRSRSVATPAISKLECVSATFPSAMEAAHQGRLWDARIPESARVDRQFRVAPVKTRRT